MALLAESSSTSEAARHRLSSSPFAVDSTSSAAFVTPPYTPRGRSQSAADVARHHHHQQPLPPHADDLSASLMTPPSVMTLNDRHQRPRGPQMSSYTPPFTPVRPATTTPVGRPRSRLSLNCPSPLHDLTRPPSASLALVSALTRVH